MVCYKSVETFDKFDIDCAFEIRTPYHFSRTKKFNFQILINMRFFKFCQRYDKRIVEALQTLDIGRIKAFIFDFKKTGKSLLN